MACIPFLILTLRRNAADDLFAQLEQVSTKLLHALQQGKEAADAAEPTLAKADANASLLCIRKHQRDGSSASGPVGQDDVLRMLVRSSRCSRALALHLCPGASAFHVFSRRSWSRFRPLNGAVVVTVGDQLQVTNAPFSRAVPNLNWKLEIAKAIGQKEDHKTVSKRTRACKQEID
jgi:hypothetical protein